MARIKGTLGNDNLLGTSLDDLIKGFEGNDTVDAGAGNDTVLGSVGDDNIVGGAGNDVLRGETGNDTIRGGDGNDQLWSGSASNLDLLIGGAGNDTYVLRITSDRNPSLPGGRIIVEDSGGIDTIDVSRSRLGLDVDLEQGGTFGPRSINITGIVENAIGTKFDDTIRGNDVDNRLTGGTGADEFVFDTGLLGLGFLLGDDTITDFSRAEGDSIRLVGTLNLLDVVSVGNDSLLTFENLFGIESSISVLGVTDLVLGVDIFV